MKEVRSPALWLENCEPLSGLSIPLAFLYSYIERKGTVPTATLAVQSVMPMDRRALGSYMPLLSEMSGKMDEKDNVWTSPHYLLNCLLLGLGVILGLPPHGTLGAGVLLTTSRRERGLWMPRIIVLGLNLSGIFESVSRSRYTMISWLHSSTGCLLAINATLPTSKTREAFRFDSSTGAT